MSRNKRIRFPVFAEAGDDQSALRKERSIKEYFRQRLSDISSRWTRRRIARPSMTGLGIFMLFLGIVGAFIDYRNPSIKGTSFLLTYLISISAELSGLALTILAIDRLYEKGRRARLRGQHIREFGAQDAGIALRAARELQAEGWDRDGSLDGQDLVWADLSRGQLQKVRMRGAKLHWATLDHVNFQGADLRKCEFNWAKMTGAHLVESDLTEASFDGTDLQRANFYRAQATNAVFHRVDLKGVRLEQADLSGAYLATSWNLTEEQLVKAKALRKARLPELGIYDGRYRLDGDIEAATRNGVDLADPTQVAEFYQVSVEEYLQGQEWAALNLEGLRDRAGLNRFKR